MQKKVHPSEGRRPSEKKISLQRESSKKHDFSVLKQLKLMVLTQTYSTTELTRRILCLYIENHYYKYSMEILTGHETVSFAHVSYIEASVLN